MARMLCATRKERARPPRREREAAPPACRVDLASAQVSGPDGAVHAFSIPASRAQALMRGDDEIAVTLQHLPAIEAYHERARIDAAWLFPSALRKASAP
jgi:3-isopropylmalate/(R)-2-methylmalate dehydratase small subunit